MFSRHHVLLACLSAGALLFRPDDLRAQSWLLLGDRSARTRALACDAGDCLAAGTSVELPSDTPAGWAAAVSGDGSVAWSRAWTNAAGGALELSAVARAPGSGWICAGSLDEVPARAVWLKLDEDGSLLGAWVLAGPDASASVAAAGRAVDAATWIAVVATPGSGSEGSELWLVRLAADAPPDLRLRFGPFSAVGEAGLVLAADGTLIASAGVRLSPTGPVTETFLAAVTPDGGLEWQRVVSGPGGNALPSVAPAPDGGWLLAGSSGQVARLTSDGAIAWQHRLRGWASRRIEAVTHQPGGGWLLAGSAWTDTGGRVNPWLARLDEAGELRWQRSPWLRGELSSIVAAPDGSFFAGCEPALGRELVARFRADGRLESPCVVGEPVEVVTLPATATVMPALTDFRVDAVTVQPLALTESPAAAPQPAACESCRPDLYEPNDAPEQAADWPSGGDPLVATPLAGRAVGVNHCGPDADWFSFSACAGETLVFETELPGAESLSLLQVFERDGRTLLAEARGTEPGASVRLEWSAERSGGYLLNVGQADGGFGAGREADVRRSRLPAGERWSRLIGSAGHDELTSVAKGADGRVFVAGASALLSGPLPGAGLWLSALESTGELAWSRSFDSPSGSFVQGLAAAPDGGVFLAASGSNDPSDPNDPAGWLARLGADGGLVWQTASRDWLPAGLAALADGRPAVAGGSRVAVFASDGSPAWLRGTDAPRARFRAAAAASDGGLLAVGSVKESGFGADDGWMLRFDADGNLSWKRVQESADRTVLESAVELADGRWLVVGWLGGPSTEAGLALLLGAEGELEQARLLEGSPSPRVTSAAQLRDGSFLLSGTVPDPPNSIDRRDLWVGRLDPALNLTWSRAFGHFGENRAAGAVELGDGSVLLAGTAAPGLERDSGWLLRLEPEGDGGLACAEGRAIPVTSSPSAATLAPGAADGIDELTAGTLPTEWTALAVVPTLRLACDCDCPREGRLAGEVSAPGSPEPLRFEGPTRLAWESPTLNGACTFNLYRTTLDLLRLDAPVWECVEASIPVSTVSVEQLPPAGSGHAYLVAGERDGVEGSVGVGSTGRLRLIGVPCP